MQAEEFLMRPLFWVVVHLETLAVLVGVVLGMMDIARGYGKTPEWRATYVVVIGLLGGLGGWWLYTPIAGVIARVLEVLTR